MAFNAVNILGVILFAFGMASNVYCDRILASLRRDSDARNTNTKKKSDDPRQRYAIPRGWLFEYVSCANLVSEILEWTGFAIAAGTGEAAAFAFFTFCNIGPRAIKGHWWYRETFGKDYPASRKALIPFLF